MDAIPVVTTGRPKPERLDRRQPEALEDGREHEQLGIAIQLAEFVFGDVSGRSHHAGEARFIDSGCDVLGVADTDQIPAQLPDEHQLDIGNLRVDRAKGPHERAPSSCAGNGWRR